MAFRAQIGGRCDGIGGNAGCADAVVIKVIATFAMAKRKDGRESHRLAVRTLAAEAPPVGKGTNNWRGSTEKEAGR